MEQVDEVKHEVMSHFGKSLQEADIQRPIILGIKLKFISREDKVKLEYPFSDKDIKEVVWNNDGNNSPDPDGFNFGFLKKC